MDKSMNTRDSKINIKTDKQKTKRDNVSLKKAVKRQKLMKKVSQCRTRSGRGGNLSSLFEILQLCNILKSTYLFLTFKIGATKFL